MDLTESKLKSLLDGQNLNKLNDEVFDQLIRVAVDHACGKFDGPALAQLYDSKPDVTRAAYASVSQLLIETARHDTSSEELNRLLRSTTLSRPYIEKFCELYSSHKVRIQESLETIGNGLPHIIDVDWRLDYCLKSNISNPAGVTNYYISFSTMKHGDIQNVRFMCTIQELQELIYKLKDAARHIEKLSNP